MELLGLSERRVCRALGFSRSSHRYRCRTRTGEEALVQELKTLSGAHPRYGYRRIHALLKRAGWAVNRKRVQRLWREYGLKVPAQQSKRRRLGEGEAGAIRLRPSAPNECWCYDFIYDQTEDGRMLKILPVLDEYTRECLAIPVQRSLNADDVVRTLEGLALTRGAPRYIRSDNGPEFIARAVKDWVCSQGFQTVYIEPGSPWENPYSESFHSRLRDEVLNREAFSSLLEARVVLEDFKTFHNHHRPHSSLSYRTPEEVRIAEQNCRAVA